MRDYFLFYRSFFEAISTLPPEMQAEIYPAIVAYALDGTPPQALSPLANSIFKLVKPFIDANNKRRENGTKGGAPRGNQNARKNNRKTTRQNNPKTTLIRIWIRIRKGIRILIRIRNVL